MPNENKDIIRVEDTEANLPTTLIAGQLGFTTDTGKMCHRMLDGVTFQWFLSEDSTWLIWDSNGNGGITTTVPEGKLHIFTGSAGSMTANTAANELVLESAGGCGVSILSPDASNSSIYFGSPSDNLGAYLNWKYDDLLLKIGTHTSGAGIQFVTDNNIDVMRITNSEMVGIGTTNPGYKLEVKSGDLMVNLGSIRAQDNTYCTVDVSAYGTAPYSFLSLNKSRGSIGSPSAVLNGDEIGRIAFTGYGTSFKATSVIISSAAGDYTGASTPSNLYFYTVPVGSTTIALRMSIASTGYVGIGTSSAVSLQELYSNTYPQLTITAPTDSTGNHCTINWKTGSNIKFTSGYYNVGGTDYWELSPTGLAGYGLSQDINGNVGVGTAALMRAKLHIRSANSGVAPSTSADCVFIEENITTGLTLATLDAYNTNIFFDTNSLTAGAFLTWDYTSGTFHIGTSKANSYTKMGGANDYLLIDTSGNTRFIKTGAVGANGIIYGSLYFNDHTDTLTITGTGIANKVQVTSFDVDGISNQCTPDHTNDHITITYDGVYMVRAQLTFTSTGGTPYIASFGVFANNGADSFDNLHAHRSLAGGGGDVGAATITGIVYFAAGDTIEVWGWNDTNTNDIILNDISLSISQLGDYSAA